MSHRTIAAALALPADLSSGERLAAFSLASFANREHRAWPGTPRVAARAGLSKSRYLAASRTLQERELITIEGDGAGRGHSALVRLDFADAGQLIGEQINAGLFEDVLSYSRAHGSARLLLAGLAALADDARLVTEISTELLCEAAGVSEKTYRRARAQLLEGGEVRLLAAGGGRSRMNHWLLADPRGLAGEEPVRAQAHRRVPAGGARPLMTTVTAEARDHQAERERGRRGAALTEGPGHTRTDSARNPGQNRTLSAGNPGQNRTLSARNPGQTRTLSAGNPGQNRTLSPAQTPAQTPAPNARAGREPQNLLTTPPDPPEGGRAARLEISEVYLSPAGRRRSRTVHVDRAAVRAELQPPTGPDQAAWLEIRQALRDAVGQGLFEVWFSSLQLVAVADPGEVLLLVGPPATHSWVAQRHARTLAAAAERLHRVARPASSRELALLDALGAHQPPAAEPDLTTSLPEDQEAV
jgi:hypothetical protein